MTSGFDAIRERDASFHGAEFDPFTPLTGTDSAQMRAYDRRALLAEVDALNEVVLALQQAVEREGSIVDMQEDAVRLARASVEGCEAALARALPVIEAARKVLEDHPPYRLSLSTAEKNLAAALAKYDKETK